MVPSYDFFLFSLLAGLVLGIAFIGRSFALLFLAVLLAPFMAPVIGAALGTITGAVGYWFRALITLLIGCLVVFGCGALAALAAPWFGLQPTLAFAGLSAAFSWQVFIVLALGAGITTFLIVRPGPQKPLVSSVALAYCLYPPVAAAGFGLAGGVSSLLWSGLALFAAYLVWAVLISALVFALMGLRPLNGVGYFLSAVYALAGVLAIIYFQTAAPSSLYNPFLAQGAATPLPTEATPLAGASFTPQPSPTFPPTLSPTSAPPTQTEIATPTKTLVPTRTPTLTITPQPTPVWALVTAKQGGGIIIREQPAADSVVVQTLINGNLVQILPDDVIDQGHGWVWVHVRAPNGVEGWVIQTYLTTATPAPGQ